MNKTPLRPDTSLLLNQMRASGTPFGRTALDFGDKSDLKAKDNYLKTDFNKFSDLRGGLSVPKSLILSNPDSANRSTGKYISKLLTSTGGVDSLSKNLHIDKEIERRYGGHEMGKFGSASGEKLTKSERESTEKPKNYSGAKDSKPKQLNIDSVNEEGKVDSTPDKNIADFEIIMNQGPEQSTSTKTQSGNDSQGKSLVEAQKWDLKQDLALIDFAKGKEHINSKEIWETAAQQKKILECESRTGEAMRTRYKEYLQNLTEEEIAKMKSYYEEHSNGIVYYKSIVIEEEDGKKKFEKHILNISAIQPDHQVKINIPRYTGNIKFFLLLVQRS